MARTIEQITEQLEAMIDEHSVVEVLEAISVVCSLKADHVRSNWQDEQLAHDLEYQSNEIDYLAGKLSRRLK